MDYKQTARSPHYGRIFAYNETGKQVQELDILKIKLVHQNREYTVGQLLERVFTLENENMVLMHAASQTENFLTAQEELNSLLKLTLEALNKKIDEVASKNTII